MKKFLIIVGAMLSAWSLFAQFPGGDSKQAAPQIGRIYGKIVDGSGRGIGEATVILLQKKMDSASKKMKEILIRGVVSQANGDFNLEGVPIFGQLKLTISATGYQPFEKAVAFQLKMPAGVKQPARNDGEMTDMSQIGSMAAAFEKDMGKISLQTDVQQLASVTVTSGVGRLKMDIDKKVFSVGQDIVNAGGTAVDLMKNIPSVQVDIDGNVTLRNATPQIYIDGRPTVLTLDQIPADAIESVEIITNPSAKYDASGGGAGILNIVLKKNKKKGYNGTIMTGVDKRGALNGNLSFNLREDKFNFSVSVFGNQMKNRTTGSTDITNLLTMPELLVDQNDKSRMSGGFLFGRAAIDYFPTNRTTFSLGYIKVHGSFNTNDLLSADSLYQGGAYVSYSERNTVSKRGIDANGVQGAFKYLFPKQGEELTADLNYFSGKNTNTALYNTDIYSSQGGAKTGNLIQQIPGGGSNDFLTIQTDYVKPFSGSAKLEAGLRAQLRHLSNSQNNYFYDAGSGQFILIPSVSNNYSDKDNVYAGYISLTNTIGNFGYKAGLRAERSDYEGKLTGTDQPFTNKYPISLFPSLFLSEKLKNDQELQLSYTRRINRPFFMQIIPFIDSSDQSNWSRGNPALKPEFTNSLEASWTKTFDKNNTLLVSAYYKFSSNLITRYLDTITVASGDKRPVNTYINADFGRTVGAEFTSQNSLANWWDMNANINIYNSRINTDNVSGSSQNGLWSWFAKMNNNFKLPENFKLQLSGTYQSKTNLPVSQGSGFGPGGGGGGPGSGSQSASQGYIKANYGIDAAVQKNLLKGNAASISFSVSDIFRTRRFIQYSESNFFIQNSDRINDVPMMRLTFSWRFGQMDMSLFRRKDMKSESEGTQGAMQGVQQ